MVKFFWGNGVEFLTGTQMKGTRGGNDGYGYGYSASGTCAARGKEDAGKRNYYCGVSITQAKFMGDHPGCNWCCDSCNTTDWYLENC